MYRIDNASAVSPRPTPGGVGVNPNFYFTNGNVSLGIPGTDVDADWMNAVQEEICNVILGAGLTLSKTTENQLFQAISLLTSSGSGSYAVSTSSPNTYTATLTSAPTSYSSGMIAFIKFTNANTASATINLNSIGAETITRLDGSALQAGDISAGMIGILMWDGTNFQLANRFVGTSVAVTDVQNSALTFALCSSAANTYAISLTPAITSYVQGLRVYVKFTNANTGTSTLNVNSLGAKLISNTNGGGLGSGDIQAGMIGILEYDGTTFQLLNPSLVNNINSLSALLKAGIQDSFYTYAVDSGSGNAYAATLVPAVASYTAGLEVTLIPAGTNSGASTLNVNGLGAKSIGKICGGGVTLTIALSGKEIITGAPARFIYNGTGFILLNPAPVPDQVTILTGSGTYTTPLGAISLEVELLGGGAGGQGNSASGTTVTTATNGAATTFGTSFLVANGGNVGSPTASNYQPGLGGTASGGDINTTGGCGGSGQQCVAGDQQCGGIGGKSFLGGEGSPGTIGAGAGGGASANSGSGGGGGGGSGTAAQVTGGGGGSGGRCKKFIPNPAASYLYSVGGGGNAGLGSTSNGGNGAQGQISVRACFQ